MRIETTYYAFDETEFDNREECLAYEEACIDSVNNAVAFFDEDLKRMTTETNDIQAIAENAMFMKIMDGEKATRLLKWLYDYTGCCITEGLPETLKAGELYAWNNADYGWYNPVAQLEELRKTVDAIEKAVNAS